MITIVHGDNIEESQVKFSQIKSSVGNVTTIEGSTASKEILFDYFSGSSLFYSDKNIAIENLLSKNRPSKNLDSMVDLINKNSDIGEIMLWEEKELTAKALSQFPDAKVLIYKIPKLIFNFLDAIKPDNGKQLVILFHELIKNTSIEIVLFMLIRQLRFLIALSSKEANLIDDALRMAPWQRGKMHKQASLFSAIELKIIHGKLYKIDVGSKTGKLNMPLSSAIDIFLLSI